MKTDDEQYRDWLDSIDGASQLLDGTAQTMASVTSPGAQEDRVGPEAAAFPDDTPIDPGKAAAERARVEQEKLERTAREYQQVLKARDLGKKWYEQEQAGESARASRMVDLGPYLDGSYRAPQPSIGAARRDQAQMLYPGKWHTLIGMTTAGKTWWALWHVAAEIARGNHVAYGHFEEADPGGTVQRLLALGVSPDQIMKLFHWLDCNRRWTDGEFGQLLDSLETLPTLVVLDGINAACGQHGWPVNEPQAIGAYRRTLATPATSRGCAVLSLGHPVKARDRQDERHSFGSTAWLDEVDGVGFRMVATNNPIRRGFQGASTVWTVKDRYGQVEQHGHTDPDKAEGGWYRLGVFEVDSARPGIAASMYTPVVKQDGTPPDQVDTLADEIVKLLKQRDPRQFTSVKGDLQPSLVAAGVKFNKNLVEPALQRLEAQRLLAWPHTGNGRPRPGWLQDPQLAGEQSEMSWDATGRSPGNTPSDRPGETVLPSCPPRAAGRSGRSSPTVLQDGHRTVQDGQDGRSCPACSEPLPHGVNFHTACAKKLDNQDVGGWDDGSHR